MSGTVRALPLAVVLLLTGCSAVPGFVANSLGLPARAKVVMAKRGTGELIAVDLTTCHVSSSRFASVRISDEVICFWSDEVRKEGI